MFGLQVIQADCIHNNPKSNKTGATWCIKTLNIHIVPAVAAVSLGLKFRRNFVLMVSAENINMSLKRQLPAAVTIKNAHSSWITVMLAENPHTKEELSVH